MLSRVLLEMKIMFFGIKFNGKIRIYKIFGDTVFKVCGIFSEIYIR